MDRDRKLLAVSAGLCAAAVGVFGFARLRAYPPHEDEVLALFVGRDSLGGLLDTVLTERGGAPLHYLAAWAVAHLGGGLDALRLFSLLCAVASVPLMAALAARLVGPRRAVAATVLASASWVFLFHAVFGRMYALFLLAATASFLALVCRRWGWWTAATLAALGAHPYGALLLAAQLAYLVLTRAREALPWAVVIVAAALPLWYADFVLAGRYDEGAAAKATGEFAREAAGDLTSGYVPALVIAAVLAAIGFTRVRARTLVACVIAIAVVALVLAALTSASPESRHLVFLLPFVAALVAAGLPRRAVLAVPLTAALVALELAWAWNRTPELFEGEAEAAIRADAGAWLAQGARADDLLNGYHPLFLSAWEQDRDFSDRVVPRADAELAVAAVPNDRLGRAIFVVERSGRQPAAFPPSAFEGLDSRGFGRYLVFRTTEPVDGPRRYFEFAARVGGIGELLGDPDAGVNLDTAQLALARLDQAERSSRSTASR
jgi:hypothetical protein